MWRSRLPAIAAFVCAALYVLHFLHRGWLPHDDGMLAQAGQRVLTGELPHRDFSDPYTGGLAWLNAWTFRMLGDHLTSLRVVLFAAFLAWVPVVQYIASRFLRPWPAALVTLLCVSWSLPNYPAAMPSWYNLFFATFGAASLLRFVEDRRRRWLVLAGISAGVSILIKISGLYFLAAGLLSLIALRSTEGDSGDDVSYAAFIALGLVLFVGALSSLIRGAFHAAEVVNFVVPGASLAAAIAWVEWKRRAGHAAFRELTGLVFPFLLGAAIPVLLFVIPFVRADAVGDLVRGVFVSPQRRLAFAYRPPAAMWTMAVAIPVVGALAVVARRSQALSRWTLGVVAAIAALCLWVARAHPATYQAIWFALLAGPVFLTVMAAWRITRPLGPNETLLGRERLAILTATLACCTLIQFPYSTPVYFSYVAPLFLLAVLPWLEGASRPLSRSLAVGGGFLLGFAVLLVNGAELHTVGVRYEAPPQLRPLDLERGGILVTSGQARIYEELIAALQARAHGGYTWASPDAPEIYYLSGLRNPTRSFYEFLDDSPDQDAAALRAIDQHGVTAIVLNLNPFFSPKMTQPMYEQLVRRFPHGQTFGSLHLMWRD